MIKEISVYIPNKAGEFNRILQVLSEGDINVLAFSIDQAGPYSIIRLICNKPEKANKQLSAKAFVVDFVEVHSIKMSHKPGELKRVTSMFAKHNINIEYGYLTLISETNEAVVILKTDNPKIASRLIVESGLEEVNNFQ